LLRIEREEGRWLLLDARRGIGAQTCRRRPPPPGPKTVEFDAKALRERIQLEARQQGADVAPKR